MLCPHSFEHATKIVPHLIDLKLITAPHLIEDAF